MAYLFSHFSRRFLLLTKPMSIISIMPKPPHSPFYWPYSLIATPTLSFVSHAVCGLISFPSLATRFFVIRHQFSSLSSAVWTPQRFNKFSSLLLDAKWCKCHGGDGHHWLIVFVLTGLEFDTEQALFDFYVKALATVVGRLDILTIFYSLSEAEAKNKIYLVSVASEIFGFGAEIDENTKNKLIDTHRLQNLQVIAYEDHYYGARNKDLNIQSAPRFTPVNWHRRLDNIFSYHHLSERNLKWNSDHWLINTKEPGSGFTKREIVDFYINLLADFVGSEKEAKERIYMIWLKFPFGFAAVIDGETSNKLKGLADILKVLPDYAFFVDMGDDAILVRPPSQKMAFSYYLLSKDSGFEDCGVSMDDNVGLSRRDLKHWFIRMGNPGGECASIQQKIDVYVQTLAIVFGSEEEAEKKIYRVQCEGTSFGFGAEIDVEASNKLKGMPEVLSVLPDCIFNSGCRIQSGPQFTPINRNHRLDDIYSYHHLSKCSGEWCSDHWLVHVRQLDYEVGTVQQTVDFCIQLLAEVVGSEKDAKEKIYIVWSKMPFGFGAEIDEKTSNKLKGLPDVLMVLPDYAFDVKNKDRGALVISSSSCVKSDSEYEGYDYWLLPNLTDSEADY